MLDLPQTTDSKTRTRRSGEGKEVPGAAQITLAQVRLWVRLRDIGLY